MSHLQGIELTITSVDGLKQRHTDVKGDNESDEPEDAPVTQSQIMARALRSQIRKLTTASLIASLIHVMVTIVTLCMAFSVEGEPHFDDNGINIVQPAPARTYSSTGVICAFGSLTTCVYVFSASWKTYKGAIQTELPNWEWHNDSFLTAVGTAFFLIIFLWPALDNFILHSLGQNFFPLINALSGTTKATAVTLIVFAIVLFLLDIIAIIYTTTRLSILQAPRKAAAEDARATGIGAMTNGVLGSGDDDPKAHDSDDENEHEDVPDATDIQFIFLTWKQKVLASLMLAMHTAYGVTLIVVAAKTGGNSGAVICIVLYTPFWLLFMICSYWFFRSSIANENWLIKFRIATVLHFVAAYCIFWVSLVIFTLKNNVDTTARLDFFSSITRIRQYETDGPGRAALAIVLLICFPAILSVYSVILYFHTKAMWALDELASLRLLERLQQFNHQSY